MKPGASLASVALSLHFYTTVQLLRQDCRYWACQSLLVKKGCTRFACPNYLVVHLIFQFITDHFLTHLRRFQDCRICSCYSLSLRNDAHVLLGPASRLLEHTLCLEQLYGCLVQPLYTCTPTGDLLWTNPCIPLF